LAVALAHQPIIGLQSAGSKKAQFQHLQSVADQIKVYVFAATSMHAFPKTAVSSRGMLALLQPHVLALFAIVHGGFNRFGIPFGSNIYNVIR
jgi:hypothetical protein